MKNETTNPTSTINRIKPPLVLVACLILTALGPPAAELSRADGGRGGPPVPVNYTFVASGECAFDVQITVTSRQAVINLPNGGLIINAPTAHGTFTNLSDPTKSVTLNITGVFHITFDQNGDTIYMVTGRNGFVDPTVGLLLLIGDFTFVYDSNGNLISGPTGSGQITSICDMIN